MDKTNKTFVEFAVKNGWKKIKAGKDGTIVYYENMGILITKEYQLKPVFIVGDTYFELLSGKVFMYGEYAREIIEAVKIEYRFNMDRFKFRVFNLRENKYLDMPIYMTQDGKLIDKTLEEDWFDGGKRKYIRHNKNGNFFDNGTRNSHDIISKWEVK